MKNICNECETVAHCSVHGCIPKVPTLEVAARQALHVLTSCEMSDYGRKWVWPDTAHPTAMDTVHEAITALRQALDKCQHGVEDGACKECYEQQPSNDLNNGVPPLCPQPKEGETFVVSYEQQLTIPEQPEAQTESEKRAYAFGWWKAMEYVRQNGILK